ncbi:MAG: hypothetical protein PHG29_02830, partial [Prolixibacteraceae bacterium]|nr:hypothetical protein [Prolixibacteraceae bacterium]
MKRMKNLFLLFILIGLPFAVLSANHKDILQQEALETGLAQSLLKDFSELGFPDYDDRNFWNSLPSVLCEEYINDAEK